MKVDYICHSGSDLLVVNAARTSLDKQKDTLDDADLRLLRYLASQRPMHWAPFSHPQLTARITAPIFVARQLFRHQVGLAVSEVSRRYVYSEPEIYTPPVWRAKPLTGIKQGSGGPLDSFSQTTADAVYLAAMGVAQKAYRELLGLGVAPEQARMVLPQAMMTTWLWTGSLYAFYRVVAHRLPAEAQAETREIARQLDALLTERFPAAYGALKECAGQGGDRPCLTLLELQRETPEAG